MLGNERDPRVSANKGLENDGAVPSLAGSPFIAGHMAPSAIKTSMIDFSSFGGGGFPLASTCGGVVVEGLDLNRRINGWPNGNVGLLRVGAHSCSTI